MAEVRVEIPDREYQIYIGNHCWDQLAKLRNLLPRVKNGLIVTDSQVLSLYGNIVREALESMGLKTHVFSFSPGEKAKCLEVADQIYTQAIQAGLGRNDAIIALGGGVAGDLAGFIAATYLRGVEFVQIPTSLLAQVDSSIGGKVAVNHLLGKNLIGAFYQPKFVLVDTQVLQTLPEREYVSGLAEVIKHGIIKDRNLFFFLEEKRHEIKNRDAQVMEEVIRRNCEIKAGIVARDEKEAGERMLLNFGHTIGHALEAITHYSGYIHGEAVAVGMVGAMKLSEKLGLVNSADTKRVEDLLTFFSLPVKTSVDMRGILEVLERDKKNIGGKMHWIVVREIGQAEISVDIETETIQNVLNEIWIHD